MGVPVLLVGLHAWPIVVVHAAWTTVVLVHCVAYWLPWACCAMNSADITAV